jgi:hypothetical protein
MKSKNESSSVRSDIVAVRKDYAAPPGLAVVFLMDGSTKRCRAYGAPMTQVANGAMS